MPWLRLAALVLLGLFFVASSAHGHGHSHSHSHTSFDPTLRSPALARLPTGATKPRGWLLEELSLQATGLSGALPDFWGFINRSAWVNPGGGSTPQQFVPYYLNGLIPLSYQLEDQPAAVSAKLASIRDRYVAYILAHQQTSAGMGWLGPSIPRSTTVREGVVDPRDSPAREYWSKYLAVEAIESYAEYAEYAEALAEALKADTTTTAATTATNAATTTTTATTTTITTATTTTTTTLRANATAVKDALIAHHRAFWLQLKDNQPPLNESRWGFARYSDGIVGIQWLLDHGEGDTSDTAFLWSLMRSLRDGSDAIMAAADHSWEAYFREGVDPFAAHDDGEATGTVHLLRHGVDIGQAMKTGALWWRVDGKKEDLENPAAALRWAEDFLHRPDGMYFADEEVGGSNTPRYVITYFSLCSVYVQSMFSQCSV